MTKIVTVQQSRFESDAWSAADQQAAVAALEDGDVVMIPGLTLAIAEEERGLFARDARIADGISKNITLDPFLNKMSGIDPNSPSRGLVEALLRRYKTETVGWLGRLLGEQGGRFEPQRTTFRPVEIRNRETVAKAAAAGSYRYDDTLLHVDAFKRRPMGERRIFRVFSNLNPYGEPRVWKVGGDFEAYARRFIGKIRTPLPGELALLNLMGKTHWRRRRYDHIMLNLHDLGKLDAEYQQNPSHTMVEFQPDCTWMCFTDGVQHAALAGCYAVEQTFEISYRDMAEPNKSPQMVLQRVTGSAVL